MKQLAFRCDAAEARPVTSAGENWALRSVESLWMEPQIIILKSFLTESIYSLSDTTKSFLLILLTDLLVGFHSPRGWEIFLEIILRHFGLPENQDFIFLFVMWNPLIFIDFYVYKSKRISYINTYFS